MNIREARAIIVNKLKEAEREIKAYDTIDSHLGGYYCSEVRGPLYTVTDILTNVLRQVDKYIKENNIP